MDPFNSSRPSVHASNGMVATSQPLASLVGIEVLKSGGNAVDAAIAIAAMMAVCEPMMSGLGGDVFAIIYSSKERAIRGLNASGIQPKRLSLEYFKRKNLKTIPEEGPESINIPGAFDGWVTLHEKYGSKPLRALLEPAISYAKEGFAVGEKISEVWGYGASKLLLYPSSAKAYLIDGKAPSRGSIFRQKELGETLEFLGKEGREGFYNGPVAEKIVASCPLLTLEDFKAQKSEWVETIFANYRGYTIHEIPPNGQGLVTLETLKILEGFPLNKMSLIAYEHTILEALKLSFADGHRYIADPHFFKTPLKELLSETFIQRRREKILQDRALPLVTPGKIPGNTTYFTVVDKDRNAVSFITSISDVFGSGIVPEGTGIVMNNRGASFSLDPNHPNVVAAHKRPYHSIIPAMVFKGEDLFLSLGCMGGNMQPQGQVQILSNIIDRNMKLQEAISAPRVRVLEGNKCSIEETFPQSLIKGLLALGHEEVFGEKVPSNWKMAHPFVQSFKGSAQAIMIDAKEKSLVGASDSRLDGLALGY
ncbi:MAG: gamma-glutamyltransferase [Verrucomicrobia bacterium]|nr:gamma-glutamyltransferase [Verrucomicrobiota bacterium]